MKVVKVAKTNKMFGQKIAEQRGGSEAAKILKQSMIARLPLSLGRSFSIPNYKTQSATAKKLTAS